MIAPELRPRAEAPHPLAQFVSPFFSRVRRLELDLVLREVHTGLTPDGVVEAALASIQLAAERQAAARARANALRTRHHEATDRRQVLVDFLHETRAGSTLRLDLAALLRDLDLQALLEREALVVEESGAVAEVAVAVLGGAMARLHRHEARHRYDSEVCDTLTALATDPRPATRRLAPRVLLDLGRRLGRIAPILPALLEDLEGDPWVRRAAAGVVLLLDEARAVPLVTHCLTEAGREPMLVRAAILEILASKSPPWADPFVQAAHADPSELVRFTVVDALRDDPRLRRWLSHPNERTRARAVARWLEGDANDLLPMVAAIASSPLVASFAMDGLAAHALRDELPGKVRDSVTELIRTAAPGLARRAALVLASDEARRSRVFHTAVSLRKLEPGASRTMHLPKGVRVEELATALIPFATHGHGFWLEGSQGSITVFRGDPVGVKAWRVLHELRRPSPSKRQSISHVTGRVDAGAIRVPPMRLAEESATGVPGQRLRVDREDGWVAPLPMVDDFDHAARRGAVQIFGAEGTVLVRAPERWTERVKARLSIVWNYRKLDAARTAALAEPEPELRSHYVAPFLERGYRIEAKLHAPWAPYVRPAWIDPLAYLFAADENTIPHLAIVIGFLLIWLFARQTFLHRSISRARAAIPLVLGGWGTRGKSGTERLKAAVIEGRGLPLLSKTTGCEAMILHAPPGGHAIELFLFRPYDKASIWEQADVIHLGEAFKVRAILWECMALNPIYVDILQGRWMKDDLSTLTNAYPDHEDIQGPTGLDVARVIGGFSPRNATVCTTEEMMLPVLREAAGERGATVWAVPRVLRELVPEDLLARMPHTEHPANVALAATAASALEIPFTEAVGWMADHVVPDLGALFISPIAALEGRTVQFANGMSANDTLSFRHNWRRCGFKDHDTAADSSIWLTTVINNRGDRVARSRVFATVVTEDASAHRHVLIGTNTQGFMQYLDAAIQTRLAGTTLDNEDRVDGLFAHLRLVAPDALTRDLLRRTGDDPTAADAFADAVAALALPPPDLASARAVAEGTRAALTALEARGAALEGLADALVEETARWLVWQAARKDPSRAGEAWASLLRTAVIVIEDPAATGDAIMAQAARVAPPGAFVRIMGVQNIKGTGLDFAYQWVYWRELAPHLTELSSPRAERRLAALDAIENNPLGSVLAIDATIAAIDRCDDSALAPRLVALRARIVEKRAIVVTKRTAKQAAPTRLQRVMRVAESALDPFDAIWRRRRAQQVFRDLAEQRISHPRAAEILQELTYRQKGGWLWKRF